MFGIAGACVCACTRLPGRAFQWTGIRLGMAPLRPGALINAESSARNANHVDTWTAGQPPVRRAAVRYIAGAPTAPTFSGALADRWSERAVIWGPLCVMALRRAG